MTLPVIFAGVLVVSTSVVLFLALRSPKLVECDCKEICKKEQQSVNADRRIKCAREKESSSV